MADGGFLERASALVPVLRERAIATSEARCVPTETIRDFWDAGLFYLLRPRKFGGPELAVDAVLEIGGELARGDGSAAWVWTVLSVHDLMTALFPEEAQREFWATDRTLMASSFAPTGKATPAKGGFTLSGKWSFCSGIDHSTWMLLGAFCGMASTNPPIPDIRYFLLPKEMGAVIDDWHVLGLCGTGSKSFAVENVFVPEHRMLKGEDIASASPPGAKVHDGPLYRAPLWAVFPFFISATAAGIARGALESFTGEMRSRRNSFDQSPMSGSPGIQMRVAEAGALVDAAQLLYRRSASETVARIMAGETLTVEHRVRSRRDQCYSVELAKRATQLLLAGDGGRGLYERNHVQRAFRDLQAVSGHLVAGWDRAALSYGQVMLGGKPTDPLF